MAIDFEALELEPKKGAVGLILDINEVEVTPSRETVVWSAKTRTAVINSYNKIVETATKLVNTDLNSTKDYLEWLCKVSSIKASLASGNSNDRNSIIQRLSGIIDSSTINKIYYRNNGLTKLFTKDLKKVIGDHFLLRIFAYEKHTNKIVRTKIKTVTDLHTFNFYVTDGASDKYKDRYIFENIEKQAFIVIKRLEHWQSTTEGTLIGNSKILVNYDTIIVPDTFKDIYVQEELNGNNILDSEDTTTVSVDSNYRAKLRKLEEKILLHEAQGHYSGVTYSSVEFKIKDILLNYKNNTILYGSFANRSLINSVLTLCPTTIFIDNHIDNSNYLYNEIHSIFKPLLKSMNVKKNLPTIRAILVNKEGIKHLQEINNFKYIADFIVESYTNGKIIINKLIRFVLTFYVIKRLLNKYAIPYKNNMSFLGNSEKNAFFTQEFINILGIVVQFPDDVSILPMFQAGINYELGKDSLDISTLNDYMYDLNENLPDELCDNIDEITDIHILDIELINKVEIYCKKYVRYFSIIDNLVNYTDNSTYKFLGELAKNYEEFPEELGYFQ